jgi:hypothetical protein
LRCPHRISVEQLIELKLTKISTLFFGTNSLSWQITTGLLFFRSDEMTGLTEFRGLWYVVLDKLLVARFSMVCVHSDDKIILTEHHGSSPALLDALDILTGPYGISPALSGELFLEICQYTFLPNVSWYTVNKRILVHLKVHTN